MSDATQIEPTLEDLLRIIIDGETSNHLGPVPATVTAYDSAKQVCDAKPLVMVAINGELRRLPIARGVQVRWPSGANWSLVAPMTMGDIVWLRPSGADISHWKQSGADNATEATTRRYSLSDVVAEPGTRPLSNALPATAYSTTAVVLAAAEIRLGDSEAADLVALSKLVESELATLAAAINGHNHTHPNGPTTGLVPGSGVTTPYDPSVACTKVKAK